MAKKFITMSNLRKIIQENIEKRYQINESFEKIFLCENEEDKLGYAIDFYDNLLNEGYNENEIESEINEQMSWMQSLFNSDQGTNPEDFKTQTKAINTAGKAGVSQFKTFLIKTFLKAVGFEGPLASALATAMSEMSLMDIIAVFRSKEGCMAHSGDVAGGVLEAMAIYIAQSNSRKDSLVYNYLINLSREMLRNSGYDKKIGQFICNYAYKVRQKTIPKKQTSKTI